MRDRPNDDPDVFFTTLPRNAERDSPLLRLGIHTLAAPNAGRSARPDSAGCQTGCCMPYPGSTRAEHPAQLVYHSSQRGGTKELAVYTARS